MIRLNTQAPGPPSTHRPPAAAEAAAGETAASAAPPDTAPPPPDAPKVEQHRRVLLRHGVGVARHAGGGNVLRKPRQLGEDGTAAAHQLQQRAAAHV